jgi:uncharacterized protein (DUF4415 family)
VKRRSIKSDLKRIDALKDRDIDYSDIPRLDDSFFKRPHVELPKPKTPITIRVDPEVLDWFRSIGPKYQTRINAVLKAYMLSHKKAS